MAHWINVTAASGLAEGARECLQIEDGRQVVVARVDGEIVAFEDRCSHEDLPLSDGDIVAGEIVCPYHGATFCVRTGEPMAAPAYEPITVFPTEVVDDVIRIDIA